MIREYASNVSNMKEGHLLKMKVEGLSNFEVKEIFYSC